MGTPCKKCGFILDDDAQFCSKCGTKVVAFRCQTCGKIIPDDSSFCPICGAPTTIAKSRTTTATSGPITSPNESSATQAIPVFQETAPSSPKSPKREAEEASFSCTYYNLLNSFTEITSKLYSDHILISKRLGRNTVKCETLAEIPYSDIAGTAVQTKHSPLIITLFGTLLALTVCIPFSKNGGVLIAFLVFILTIAGIWRYSFQIRHLELVITEKTGKETCIPYNTKADLVKIQSLLQGKLERRVLSESALQLIIEKRTPYYYRQFNNITSVKQSNFNWAAFLFGPIFCFYRSGGKLFREFFLTFYILLGTFSIVFSVFTTLFVKNANDIVLPWGITYIVLAIALFIYYLFCTIRCGKQFNQHYAQYCQTQLAIYPQKKKQNETSIPKAIIASIVIGLYVGIVNAICALLIVNSCIGLLFGGLNRYDLPFHDTVSIPINDTDNQNIEPVSDAISLSDYIGTWYVTSADDNGAFSASTYTDLLGLELELVELDSEYYAYLYSTLDTSSSPAYQSINGDTLLPIIQDTDDTWKIRYDEVNSATGEKVGQAVLTLSINPLGEVYAEISSTSIYEMNRTKLFNISEWQDGQYLYYDKNNSYSHDFDGTYPMPALLCESSLRECVYGTWYSGTGSSAERTQIDPGNIYVRSAKWELYRDNSFYVNFSYKSDPSITHTLCAPYLADEISIDGRPYYKDFVSANASVSYPPSADALQYFIAHCDTEYFTEADIQTFDADMCRVARNSIYARLGRKFDSQDLTLYFEQYDWYIPVIDPEDFSDEMLNQYQVANRDLIVAFETQKGYR